MQQAQDSWRRVHAPGVPLPAEAVRSQGCGRLRDMTEGCLVLHNQCHPSSAFVASLLTHNLCVILLDTILPHARHREAICECTAYRVLAAARCLSRAQSVSLRCWLQPCIYAYQEPPPGLDQEVCRDSGVLQVKCPVLGPRCPPALQLPGRAARPAHHLRQDGLPDACIPREPINGL